MLVFVVKKIENYNLSNAIVSIVLHSKCEVIIEIILANTSYSNAIILILYPLVLHIKGQWPRRFELRKFGAPGEQAPIGRLNNMIWWFPGYIKH